VTARRGLVWPLLLICLGVVFLAANFGLIGPVSVVAVLSLWPLILIIVGIDIAIGRRWPLAALAASALVIVAGLALASLGPATPGGIFPVFVGGSNGTTTSTVDVPRSDAKSISLRVSAGAGTYELRGGAISFVHAESDHDDLRLSRADRSGDRIDIRVDQGPSGNGFRFGPSAASHVKVQVASDIPTSLVVDAGAGDFAIDLSDVKVTDARLSIGAASLRFVLPRPAGEVPVTISAGASSIVIEIPDGVEAHITTGGGLTSSRAENSRFSGSETSGYAAAKDRVTVRISAGVTSIVIR
jgi:hypothetical protein